MKMRLAILNPNATRTMTDDMVTAARAAVPTDVEVVGYTNLAGPPAIQGAEDALACLPGLFALYDTALAEGATGVVVGCFDDTGLAELRARCAGPIAGLGEAGCLAASLHRAEFAVLTTTEGSVPVIADNIDLMGLAPRCRGVVAAGVPVLGLAAGLPQLRATLAGLLETAPEAAVVLGCAGMSPLAGQIAEGVDVPIIDPVLAATALVLSAARAAQRDPATSLERSA
ncbi:Asp/Glu/Hydantoin racemase (plasmid) [Dinoroseobacter shibae DFL 12 = DSM 16493]|jgi:allantoin racemase|uniref:Asp/Glu/Hydantoin racemase n=2 Tax=Dinoroseobacter shibae TaxID=215813 RepID=A8LTG0_DINSH|nr:Asp/Glu/Hydantoin racemase [Dinoroseobacter shibae DFL 12 = DSM 16493]